MSLCAEDAFSSQVLKACSRLFACLPYQSQDKVLTNYVLKGSLVPPI